MIRTQFAALALGLFIASPAVAQTNLAGDWDVTITSPQGANTSKVTFKQDANKLDGMIKSPAGETPIATTTAGKISGYTEDGIHIFKSVPYGADTVRTRFQPPVPPEKWTRQNGFAGGCMIY